MSSRKFQIDIRTPAMARKMVVRTLAMAETTAERPFAILLITPPIVI